MDGIESQAAAGYEFTVPQNAIIEKTATYARLWGIISIVVGAIQILMGLGSWTELPGGIVSVLIGIAFVGAAGSLKAVVDTEGNDIDHMMTAVQKLGTAFLIQVGVTAVVVVLGLLLGLAAAAA